MDFPDFCCFCREKTCWRDIQRDAPKMLPTGAIIYGACRRGALNNPHNCRDFKRVKISSDLHIPPEYPVEF